jgi:hypothetical protein
VFEAISISQGCFVTIVRHPLPPILVRSPAMRFACILIVVLLAMPAVAHPVPDVPVRGEFKSKGESTIIVEVDPRSFAEDSENTPYVKKRDLDKMSNQQREELISKAHKLIESTLRFQFDPKDALKPSFEYDFEQRGDAAPDEEGGIPIKIVATWKVKLPTQATKYRMVADEQGRFSVYFLNKVDGRDQKLNVLFPGEESYWLQLPRGAVNRNESSDDASFGEGDFGSIPAGSTDRASQATGMDDVASTDADAYGISTFRAMFRQGFVHVVPLGLDHILFVLGVFLMSREWKPLLLQVSAFTVAHTVTLALSTLGIFRPSPSIVEPLIAISIVVIAVENLFTEHRLRWRVATVFAFGLIHGLGFAGALSDIFRGGKLVAALIGFNIGVEFGQIAVIAAAFVLTAAVAEKHYRKFVVVPGSLAIAAIGLFWTFERIHSVLGA